MFAAGCRGSRLQWKALFGVTARKPSSFGEREMATIGSFSAMGIPARRPALVGLNRHTFLTAPLTLFRLIAVAFISTFVLGYLIGNVSKRLRVGEKERISLMLMGTRKNYGLAAAIALLFFDPRTTTSIAVGMSVAILHFIWLNFRSRHKEINPE